MNQAEVMTLLRENQNERGILHWNKLGYDKSGYETYGIGLTQLRKLAKKIGRDRTLAHQLWASDVYDARIIGLLIDDPKQITREQAETQVEQLDVAMLPHVFASCDATLAKSGVVFEVAKEWLESTDDIRRRCGYSLLYELSKNKRNKNLTDEFFLPYLKRIEKTIHNQENWVRDSMNTALMGIGKRNLTLNKEAIRVAESIGSVDVDYGDNSCKPVNVLKHLTSDYLKTKFEDC